MVPEEMAHTILDIVDAKIHEAMRPTPPDALRTAVEKYIATVCPSPGICSMCEEYIEKNCVIKLLRAALAAAPAPSPCHNCDWADAQCPVSCALKRLAAAPAPGSCWARVSSPARRARSSSWAGAWALP